ASTTGLTFTSSDWDQPQTVVVYGVDDVKADGDQAYVIHTAPAVSSDSHYVSMNPADVSMTNVDDGVAGFTVTPTWGPRTSEAGGSATFSVVLTSQPTADVVIPVALSNAGEGAVAPASLTFTAADWNAPQTVTVTGVDDQIQDGAIAYNIVLGAAVSGDPI